jgi:hypothetical protein
MNSHWSNQSAVIAMFALLVACAAGLRAQDTGSSVPGGMQQTAAALTGEQQSAANRALCSAVESHFLILPQPDLPRSATQPCCLPRLHHSPAARIFRFPKRLAC